MDVSGMRIVADEREKKSRIPELLGESGVFVEMRRLVVGDYIVAPETAVERKSIRDFISSVFDGRLFDQCARLRENFESPLIIMEGDTDTIPELVENPMVFYGAVSRIVLEYRIPVVPTPSAAYSARLLVCLAARREPGGELVKKIRKSRDPHIQQVSFLCGLPGVAEKTATRMLERFETPLGALCASAAEISRIDGMGTVRARRIKKMLGSSVRKRGRGGQRTLHGK